MGNAVDTYLFYVTQFNGDRLLFEDWGYRGITSPVFLDCNMQNTCLERPQNNTNELFATRKDGETPMKGTTLRRCKLNDRLSLIFDINESFDDGSNGFILGTQRPDHWPKHALE